MYSNELCKTDYSPQTIAARRTHKDRLFCHLFSEKQNALSLFNAVSGTNFQDEAALQIVTLDDALYLTMKNDLAICFHSRLALFEQQSTDNPNMPLRGLLYFAREYEGWLAQNSCNIYGSRQIQIPAPRYYVLYNGEKELPEHKEYRLSQAFSLPSEGYEWTAHVINVNAGFQHALMEACPALKGYATLTSKIREHQHAGKPLQEATSEAIDYCIATGQLKTYLQKHKAEVKSMILTEYNEELHNKTLHEEGLEEGLRQGLEEGLEEGLEQALSLVLRMLSDGRINDIQKVAADKTYRTQLLQQYGLCESRK